MEQAEKNLSHPKKESVRKKLQVEFHEGNSIIL